MDVRDDNKNRGKEDLPQTFWEMGKDRFRSDGSETTTSPRTKKGGKRGGAIVTTSAEGEIFLRTHDARKRGRQDEKPFQLDQQNGFKGRSVNHGPGRVGQKVEPRVGFARPGPRLVVGRKFRKERSSASKKKRSQSKHEGRNARGRDRGSSEKTFGGGSTWNSQRGQRPEEENGLNRCRGGPGGGLCWGFEDLQ